MQTNKVGFGMVNVKELSANSGKLVQYSCECNPQLHNKVARVTHVGAALYHNGRGGVYANTSQKLVKTQTLDGLVHSFIVKAGEKIPFLNFLA